MAFYQGLEAVKLVEDGSIGGVLSSLLAWSTGALEPSIDWTKGESREASIVGNEASLGDARGCWGDGGHSGLAISLD